MVFGMVPAAVGVSAATEAGLAAETGGVAAGVARGVGAGADGLDADSARFAALAAAAGPAHVATAEQHATKRGLYSGAQSWRWHDGGD